MHNVSTVDVFPRIILLERYTSNEWQFAGRSALPLWDGGFIAAYHHLHLFTVCQAVAEEYEEAVSEARVGLGSWCCFHDIPSRHCCFGYRLRVTTCFGSLRIS